MVVLRGVAVSYEQGIPVTPFSLHQTMRPNNANMAMGLDFEKQTFSK
jgi:hypothetical protein